MSKEMTLYCKLDWTNRMFYREYLKAKWQMIFKAFTRAA